MDIGRFHPTDTARRRREQIEDCLYQALLHTPWRSVSVADLCRQLGISRKAFYNYFQSKEDCFGCLVHRRYLGSTMALMNLSDDSTPMAYAVSLLNFWRDQKPFLDIVIRNDLLGLMLYHGVQHMAQTDPTALELLSLPAMPADTDILSCYVSCQLSLIFSWYYRDFQDPVEEMAQKFLRVMGHPLVAI